jgi:RNA polymerase sigma factor (TIGR02999 family)
MSLAMLRAGPGTGVGPTRDRRSTASPLRLAASNCAAAQSNHLRVAHAMSAPDEQPPASDADARVDLFATLYADLRRIAQSALRRSGSQLTVSPTTLLHEAWMKISGRDALQFPDRAHFMAYASRAMRRLVIDFVREKHALKRGAAFELTVMPTEVPEHAADAQELDRLSEALDELGTVDPGLSELVDLKFFCGFSFAEIGAMREVSERTVQRDWNKARLFLHDVMREA